MVTFAKLLCTLLLIPVAGAAASEAPDGGFFLSAPRDRAMIQAKAFFADLLAGDPEGVAARCAVPFYLEAQKLDSQEALLKQWAQILGAKRLDLLTLYGIDVLSPDAMEKKYGKPPARLALPWRNPGIWIAVANVSGHAAVALLHESGGVMKVVGYTD